MRILFDGMIPRPLARDLLPHVVSTIAQEGWGALTNGELLNAIGGRFDVLLTMDHNMAYQQKLTDRPFAVIELFAKRTTMEHIGPLLPELRSLIESDARHVLRYRERPSTRGLGHTATGSTTWWVTQVRAPYPVLAPLTQ